MNKEDYVSLEVAKLLKEKGFNEPCKSSRLKNGELRIYDTNQTWSNMTSIGNELYEYICPNFYEVQKWLIYNHGIIVNSDYDFKTGKWFYEFTVMQKPPSLEDYSDSLYSCYEQALNEGILEALKNLI